MSVSLSLFAGAGTQFFDNSGKVLTGGLLYTYAAGTTTPLATYTSNSGATPNANPIVLDSSGRLSGSSEIWLTSATAYKFVLKTSTGVTLQTLDNISSAVDTVDLAASNGSSLIGFLQAGSGAVIETVQTKLRQTVSVWDFMTEAMRADVLAGTKLVDTLPAFVAAMNSFPTNLDSANFVYPTSGTIEVPPGFYYWSDTFVITRNIKLIGVGAPFGNGKGAAQIYVAQNKTAIFFPFYTLSPTGKMATGTVIQDLFFQPKVGGGTVGHGVQMDANARLIRCIFWGFPQNGIHIKASTPNTGANQWYIQDCECVVNGGHGMYVDGADTNAGLCIMLNSTQNGGWGIWDSSFLGNTYIGCHTADNVLGPYKSDDLNAANTFIGCYSEGSQASGSSVLNNSMSIGGLHGSGFSGKSNALSATDPAGFRSRAFSASTFNIGYIVTDNNSYNIATMSSTDNDPDHFWRLQRRLGEIAWKYLGSDGYVGLTYYDSAATTGNGYQRNAIGLMGFPQGLTIGPSARLKVADADAIPSAGTWLLGDFVFNRVPSELGTAGSKYIIHGWRCVSSGTPGTWVQVRTLTGN